VAFCIPNSPPPPVLPLQLLINLLQMISKLLLTRCLRCRVRIWFHLTCDV
jgi:hypothetical protein